MYRSRMDAFINTKHVFFFIFRSFKFAFVFSVFHVQVNFILSFTYFSAKSSKIYHPKHRALSSIIVFNANFLLETVIERISCIIL